MESKKIKLGQFFTKATLWLKPQVKDFIKRSGCTIAYDPFAGGGDLLKAAKEILNFKEIKGLDIDSSLEWEINDSLLDIPHIENAIIITNPPYIAKQSASRKKIDLSQYFSTSVMLANSLIVFKKSTVFLLNQLDCLIQPFKYRDYLFFDFTVNKIEKYVKMFTGEMVWQERKLNIIDLKKD